MLAYKIFAIIALAVGVMAAPTPEIDTSGGSCTKRDQDAYYSTGC